MMTQKIIDVSALIIDMDGVLWQGNKPLAGMKEFFQCLRNQQIPFILATNNSTLTQQQYLAKLEVMGVTVSINEILTSSMATALYLSEQVNASSASVYVIGEEGLHLPLLEQGFKLHDIDQLNECDPKNNRPDFIVCGLDRKLTWEKMAIASLYLGAGSQFIATNADTSLPLEIGVVPGNGGTLAALKAVTNKCPTVVGKPQAIMYQQAIKFLGVEKEYTVAIGDRLDTDILGAVNTGIRSIMVLTGISSEADINKINYQPTWVMDDLPAITRALKSKKM